MSEPPEIPATADRTYWSDIYQTHRQAMWSAAIGRLGRDKSHLGHNAESVVHDVMRRLIKRGRVIRATNVEAYLVAAVKNVGTDVLRQEGRRQRDQPAVEAETEDSWEEPTHEDVAEAVTDTIIRDQTRKVLETMDEGPHRAFIERVIKGRPFTEIARDMDISDVQAGRLYRQAVDEIQKTLGIHPGQTE